MDFRVMRNIYKLETCIREGGQSSTNPKIFKMTAKIIISLSL